MRKAAEAVIRRIVPTTLRALGRRAYCSVVTPAEVRRLLKERRPIRLEIGSGPRAGKAGWVTLDHAFGADLCWDLLNSLPFPDNSVSIIYSSHVLEHFAYPDLLRVLKECCRVLHPGGEFSVCVPNAGIYLRGYCAPASFDRVYMTYEPALYSGTRIDTANYIAYMGGEHRHMFDEENLVHILRSVGFVSVGIREFQAGLDLDVRRHESIYGRALKPS